MNRYRLVCYLFAICFFSSSLHTSESSVFQTVIQDIADSSQNLCLSSYGFTTSLSMALEGASGETEKQLSELLEFDDFVSTPIYISSNTPEGFQIESSNAAFVDKDEILLNSFSNALREKFKALVSAIDFKNPEQSVNLINKYIEEKTSNTIQNFLSPGDIEDSLKLLLINALTFKGQWLKPFETIYLPSKNNKKKKSPYLSHIQTHRYFEDHNIQIVELSLKKALSDPTISVLLCLPKSSTIKPLALATTYLKNVHSLEFEKRHIELTFPKFSVAHTQEFKPFLMNRGIQEPFSYQADFSKINGERNLFISRIMQKSVIDFTEQGLSAAAATATFVNLKSCLPKEAEFQLTIDKPFAFALLDYDHKLCLFEGQYFPE